MQLQNQGCQEQDILDQINDFDSKIEEINKDIDSFIKPPDTFMKPTDLPKFIEKAEQTINADLSSLQSFIETKNPQKIDLLTFYDYIANWSN